MIDLPPPDFPAAVSVPQAETEKRRARRSRAARAAIGAVIILDDGRRCIVAGYDPYGNVICYPLPGQG